jgi:hypothetical protein
MVWGTAAPLVREGGFEPPWLTPVDFESTASTVPPLSPSGIRRAPDHT